MVKQFFMLSAKRFVVCLLISVPFLADISAQDYQPTRQNAYPSRFRQSSTQNQRTQNAYPSRYRQSSSQNQRTQNAYPSRYRQSSSQNQRTQDTFFSRFRQSSSQYQRNGSTRREYSNPFMKQDQNNNSRKTEKSSKRSANSGEESRQLSPSISNKKSADDVELIVTGEGRTKDDATKAALRSAIEQAFGTFVSSNTKILNEELVKDEIITVSSGNIKSYNILSESRINDKWNVTVQAVVSIGRLIEYAKSKGSEAELAGATFAMDIKMKELNRNNEEAALRNLQIQLGQMFSTIFDYDIKIGEPKYNQYRKRYSIELTITASLNKNVDECYNLFNNTLKSLSLSSAEVQSYKAKGLDVWTIVTKNCRNGNTEEVNRRTPVIKYFLRSHFNLSQLERLMLKNLCSFTLSDGVETYHFSLKEQHDHAISGSSFEIAMEKDRSQGHRGSTINSKDGCFWISSGNGYLPILASPHYAGHKISEMKLYLDYTLEELEKISKFTISPLRAETAKIGAENPSKK